MDELKSKIGEIDQMRSRSGKAKDNKDCKEPKKK